MRKQRNHLFHLFEHFLKSGLSVVFLLTFSLILSSCLENSSKALSDQSDREAIGGDRPRGEGSGSGAAPSDGGLSGGDELFESGVTELRHIIDPFDGTYKTKLTIPKNFKGVLYLSGLNVTSLSNAGKIVKVRFRLGRDLEPITVDATIGRAPGITPQTSIEVLMLDMSDSPFEDVRLLYDLFDYNDYTDETGAEVLEPVTDPRDGGLYCRGLNLEHDPTFQGSLGNLECVGGESRCLYSFAKIRDSGLMRVSDERYLNPTEPQLAIEGGSYIEDSKEVQLSKCLPDNSNKINTEAVLNSTALFTGNNLRYDETYFFDSEYVYRGPFRPLSVQSWQIRGDAVFSPYGIFKETLNDDAVYSSIDRIEGGYESLMFPRAGRLDLSSNIEHFSNDNEPFGVRTKDFLFTSGETGFVDGCNIRVMNTNPQTNEGISSCNVTAMIEVLVRTRDEDEFRVKTTSTDLKLQLIRPSQTNFEGREVLYTSLKNCSSSSACGRDECCFNERCWSTELVSQCLDEDIVVGHRGTGEVCSSDFQCSSLCCSNSVGTCQVHINNEDEKKLCSKAPGQSCIAREFCREENVTRWFVVKTTIDEESGRQLCDLRSFNVPTHGECINGRCVPPLSQPRPNFDPDDPEACVDAINPPTSTSF